MNTMDKETTKELIERLKDLCDEIEAGRPEIAHEWMLAYIGLLLKDLKKDS